MKNKKAFLLMIIAGVLWGTSGIFVNLLSDYGFSPIQLVATRATVSLVLIGAFLLIKDKGAFITKPFDLLIFLALAVTLFLSMLLYYSAIVKTSVCTAVMLLNLHPIYVTAFSAIFYKERITPVKVLSIAVMLIGCSFVSGAFGGIRLDLEGFVLGISAGISYAAYIIIVKYYNRKQISGSTANVYTFLFMTVIAVCVCQPGILVEIAVSDALYIVPLLVMLGICTSVIPFALNGMALRDLSAGTVSSLSIVEPLSATLYSAAFFGESLDIWKTVGIALILGAVVFLGVDEILSSKRDSLPKEKVSVDGAK